MPRKWHSNIWDRKIRRQVKRVGVWVWGSHAENGAFFRARTSTKNTTLRTPCETNSARQNFTTPSFIGQHLEPPFSNGGLEVLFQKVANGIIASRTQTDGGPLFRPTVMHECSVFFRSISIIQNSVRWHVPVCIPKWSFRLAHKRTAFSIQFCYVWHIAQWPAQKEITLPSRCAMETFSSQTPVYLHEMHVTSVRGVCATKPSWSQHATKPFLSPSYFHRLTLSPPPEKVRFGFWCENHCAEINKTVQKTGIIHPLNPNLWPLRLNVYLVWPTAGRNKIDMGSNHSHVWHQHVWETVCFAYVCLVLPQVVANKWRAKIIPSDPMNCGPQTVAKICPIALDQKLRKHPNLLSKQVFVNQKFCPKTCWQ